MKPDSKRSNIIEKASIMTGIPKHAIASRHKVSGSIRATALAFTLVRAANPAMTHNQIESFLMTETNPEFARDMTVLLKTEL